MAFPESFLEELSARNDIADVVSNYVHLTKKSGANLFGLCPFHSEKTPSFSVNPERQIYHCFGCGKGGSVINFIMEIENLSFPDAVQFLAHRAGMEVPEDAPDENKSRRTRMLELNRAAARFFYEQLVAPTGRTAQEYAEKRAISGVMVRAFGLGYAPDSWNALTDAMEKLGYTRPEMLDAGLVRAGKSGGVYDYFRSRLMFPVIDVRGSVIGFSGRVLGDGEPKYLNSPDTLVYSKARSLFALNLAKKSKSGYIILSEGNIDVVSLHQAGFDSAVASLGTSLTSDQARLIARYTDQVIIAYDADEAGQKASQRAIGILQPLDLKVKVLRIPGSKDPDEFIRANGPSAFHSLLEHSGNQVEYRLDNIEEKYDLSEQEGRIGFLQESEKYLASIADNVVREIYIERVAEKANVNRDAVKNDVEHFRKKQTKSAKKQLDRNASSPLRAAQPPSRQLHYTNVRSAMAERGVLNLLCRFPELFNGVMLSGMDFSSEPMGRLYDALLRRVQDGRGVSPATLEGQFAPEELALLADILQNDAVTAAAAETALRDYINTIQAEKYKASGTEDLRGYAEKLKKTKGYGGKDGN
jgi:DNA primase, catalytic core